MYSPVVFVLFAIIFISADVEGLKNLMDTPLQKCINCLCHARTGCWSRFNCASYSISTDYWKAAGSPTVGNYQTASEAYTSCMNNENCILNAINSYTESFGRMDCNCDGFFDCKDRLAIHLYGDKCTNPRFGEIYTSRFNQCASTTGANVMLDNEAKCVGSAIKYIAGTG